MAKVTVPDQFKACVGIFVGGCVLRGEGSSFRAKAHAHTSKAPRGAKYWICVRSKDRLWNEDGSPSALLWHEYAHIVADDGHTAKWRAVMARFGQPISADKARGYGRI
jgi:hypothetical protein